MNADAAFPHLRRALRPRPDARESVHELGRRLVLNGQKPEGEDPLRLWARVEFYPELAALR